MRRSTLPAVLLSVVLVAPALRAGGCCQPWTDLGQALPGTHGEPLLAGFGSLAGGTQVSLGLSNALEGSLATFVVGSVALEAPFKGGVLVPFPDLITAPVLVSPAGTASLNGIWPFGVPASSELFLQAWIADAAGPAGFAASNGVRGTTPEPPLGGGFPGDWVHGDCPEPDLQVHQYNEHTFLLRQSMCTNFEGPFLYLLFGEERALLLDSGAGGLDVASVVYDLVAQREALIGHELDLVVAHTHGHGDHKAGDPQFVGQPDTVVVGTSQSAVASFFGFDNWPQDVRTFDLGGRVLDVLAIPGHEPSHLAFYDRETALLLTGDTLYPGFLFIFGAVSQGNFTIYRESIRRLVLFTEDKPVAWVLGTHIEMTATPGVAYPYGTNFQPEERVLELTRDHLLELHQALQAMGTPVQEVHDDFIITPAG